MAREMKGNGLANLGLLVYLLAFPLPMARRQARHGKRNGNGRQRKETT